LVNDLTWRLRPFLHKPTSLFFPGTRQQTLPKQANHNLLLAGDEGSSKKQETKQQGQAGAMTIVNKIAVI
jgi:hypothetical protein